MCGKKNLTRRSDLFRLGAKLPSAGYRQSRATLTLCRASFGDEYLHLLRYWLTSSGIKAPNDLQEQFPILTELDVRLFYRSINSTSTARFQTFTQFKKMQYSMLALFAAVTGVAMASPMSLHLIRSCDAERTFFSRQHVLRA